MVIGGTVGLVSSVGRTPNLQAGGRGFESCIGHTFSSLVYFKHFKRLESILMQSLEFVRNKTCNNHADI